MKNVNIFHLLGGFSSAEELKVSYVYLLRQNQDEAQGCTSVS